MTDSALTKQTLWHANEPVILGIDEAGRGPVLGPMVYTAAFCLKSDQKALNALGVDDSKQLSEERREKMRLKIDNAPFLHTKTRVLSAAELSEGMLRRQRYNLNLISHDAAFGLLEAVINEGANVSEIYVDTVGDPLKYAAKFRERFPSIGKVVVSKKADAIYKIVGAASIVAKTTRDQHIRKWVFAEVERSARYMDCDNNLPVSFPIETGSGYPGDPATKNWIEQSCDAIFGFPSLVRFSWGTAKLILERKAVQVDWYVISVTSLYTLNSCRFNSNEFFFNVVRFVRACGFNLILLRLTGKLTKKRWKNQLENLKSRQRISNPFLLLKHPRVRVDLRRNERL